MTAKAHASPANSISYIQVPVSFVSKERGGKGDEDLLDLTRKRHVLPSILHLFLSLLQQRCTLGKIE